jgi:hypothetical protein
MEKGPIENKALIPGPEHCPEREFHKLRINTICRSCSTFLPPYPLTEEQARPFYGRPHVEPTRDPVALKYPYSPEEQAQMDAYVAVQAQIDQAKRELVTLEREAHAERSTTRLDASGNPLPGGSARVAVLEARRIAMGERIADLEREATRHLVEHTRLGRERDARMRREWAAPVTPARTGVVEGIKRALGR